MNRRNQLNRSNRLIHNVGEKERGNGGNARVKGSEWGRTTWTGGYRKEGKGSGMYGWAGYGRVAYGRNAI